MPIAPGRTFIGRSIDSGPHSSEMPQRVFQHALLQRHLRASVDVLHRTAAARARRAGRRAGTAAPHASRTRARSRSRARFRSALSAGIVRRRRASPGNAPSMKTALPSRCATPRPSWSSDSISTSNRSPLTQFTQRSTAAGQGAIVDTRASAAQATAAGNRAPAPLRPQAAARPVLHAFSENG